MAHDVFISYASEDKVVADAVCASLEAEHIRCYIAPRDVLPGQRYAQALVDAIHVARAFVLVFSAASNASDHVEHEVDRAVSCGLPILPLRVEDVMPWGSLEFYLAGQHWLDALTPPLADHLARLSEAITVLLQPPTQGARSPLKDEWPESKPEAAKPSPAETPVHEQALAVTPAATVTEKPPEAVKPPATAPPVYPPPVAKKPPEAVKPPVTARKPTTTAKHPAKPGRRPALIAAAVVGASWVVVLIAVELLVR